MARLAQTAASAEAAYHRDGSRPGILDFMKIRSKPRAQATGLASSVRFDTRIQEGFHEGFTLYHTNHTLLTYTTTLFLIY